MKYTITRRDETKTDLRYSVKLTTTPLPWGGFRYWFVCPLNDCGRRAGCLYLPPGGRYFGCRHCYDLVYESQSEWHRDRSMFGYLAGMMQDNYPGMNWEDLKDILEDKPSRHWGRLVVEWYLAERGNYDWYEGYLTEGELCRQSGLTLDNLKELEAARLLVPDTKDGRYRPKLAG